MTKVLITGATGNVGKYLLRYLTDDPEIIPIPTSRHPTPDYRLLDFNDSTTYGRSLCGINSLFLVRPPPMGDLENNIFPFLEFAKKKGVTSVIFLSILKPSKKTPHYHIEKKIIDLKFDHFVFLRAGFFMQNLIEPHGIEILENHEIFIPAGRGRTSFVDARDVAKVAAIAISSKKQSGPIHITGNRALTYYECAEIMSELLPFDVTYSKPSHRAFRKRMIQRGLSSDFVNIMSSHYWVVKFRLADRIYNDFHDITGREPTSFRQFVVDHYSQWI